MSELYDFDAAVDEIEESWWEFKFGGEDFKANLNADGSVILKWMRNSQDSAAIPELLETLLGEEEYKRLLATKQSWPKYQALVVELFRRLAGPGNV